MPESNEPERSREPTDADKAFARFGGLDEFLRRLDQSGLTGTGIPGAGAGVAGLLPRRVNADPHNVEKGLAQLVLTLIELLRQLMERQAVRRMEGGTLTDEEVERLGQTFVLLEKRMEELKKSFGLEGKDLNIDLGPLGKLL